MAGTSRTTVASVERSYEIVHALQELNGARVHELATHLDLAPSTIHKHLVTLEQLGYARKEGDEYRVGMRFLTIGGHIRNSRRGYRLAIEMVSRLVEEVDERAQFVVENGGRGIYLHTEISQHSVQIDRYTGKRRYLHSSAAGKAILAYLPDDRVEEIIDRWGLPAETAETITDREELYDELERIRSVGVAFNDGESIKGLRAVGVPVMTPHDSVLGAFSVSAPAHRLKGDLYGEELPDLILGFANELELNLLNSPQ
ncbi:IclR family transcriptional regulator [Halalkalicoccus sp. NIPERK01]|uniref:IclR family transcriptional regulator n=1 Tax=Halalkalicoccus sp. NIPERK01 TaxID=3053469 RepID=UPI00256F1250|nr:IclR family transcriptional regulator [Halalkalicoccus sp. NIPERK01]MDL5363474.1 IclR family transcriptional regulator [Halalkalicoccus sp. NIPERK01]